MNKICKLFVLIPFVIFLYSCGKQTISVIVENPSSIRMSFGAEKLKKALTENGYNVSEEKRLNTQNLIIGTTNDTSFHNYISEKGIKPDSSLKKEGFRISQFYNHIIIEGKDETGALYGCLALIDSIKRNKKLPTNLNVTDQPEMVLRGTCIGLQKTEYLPGRTVYEYPYTPENFPWFYDKEHWLEYLDMMVENRLNSLYLWNGHPFASLVKLKDYPYAVEVDDETFELNKEVFSFLTHEANKRGIYVIQMFYNILVSKPFAEHHNIKTQERSRPITPIISDYTRKSVQSFIENYPNVGLMVCLGEAMNTIEDDIEWFTKTIIPGVQDGLKTLGRIDEPPIILRGHDTKPNEVMQAALPIYKNLYTTAKYNGESLTTYEPRNSWAKIHQDLSALGSVHISNVHIMANLEPFRYGSPNFISKSVKAMHEIQGANGLHLYPQSAYWDWPFTADKTEPRTKQIDRDWIWYKAWARYAWKSNRNNMLEETYWINQFDNYYGCGEYGRDILKAYNEMGEIAPKLLRRFGISDGNRQTLLLGMMMSQLVNPYKWRVYQSFYDSNGPEGEILLKYAEREWKNQAHTGETPDQIIKEVVTHGKLAKEAIDRADNNINKNKAEFERLKNDVYCYNAFANFFAEKVKSAMLVLRYKYSGKVSDLEEALSYLENSLTYYQKLVDLTNNTYLYANSMQTDLRRIPLDGTNGQNKHWNELLPHYVTEYNNLKNNIESLISTGDKKVRKVNTLTPVDVKLYNSKLKFYSIKNNAELYEDTDYKIKDFAPELKNLKGVKLNFEEQKANGTVLEFSCDQQVKVVVGYFNGHSFKILAPPTLETNALANDRGQADIKIANAMDVSGLYPVNIYTYSYPAGNHKLVLGKGIALILGFMNGKQDIITHDSGIGVKDNLENIDWLFY